MITECRRIQQDAYINTLVEFTKIYGIGPETAKDLYTKGLRNMQDLELYYRQQLKLPNKRKRAEDFLSSLALRHDFEVKYV
jgi:DNA polymerase mu